MNQKKGIVLLFSVLAVSIVLAIALTLLSFVVKQINIVSSAKDSVNAVYAADAGIECALLWDIRGHEPGFFGARVFATTSSYDPAPGSGIDCSGVDLSNIWGAPTTVGPTTTTTFELDFGTGCAVVEVSKGGSGASERTSVLSKGYNTNCANYDSDLNTVERAIKVDYIFN